MIDKEVDFSNTDSCNKSLETYMRNKEVNIWNYPKWKMDTIILKEFDICTEQEFRIIQIRNAMSAYIKNKTVFPFNLDKTFHLETL